MKLTILQQKDEESYGAASYYKHKQKGLGYKFLDEVEKHVEWIKLNPKTVCIRTRNYRRINLKV